MRVPKALGHDVAKDLFRRTLQRGRLASTYLLAGPEGIGKRRLAEQLAAALVCTARRADPLEPCGRCEACHLSAAGNHPDVLRVAKPEGKSGVPVELLIGPPDKRNREGLCHDLALRPMLAGRRVAILDDADDLGVEAANSLLKTLEEPPPRSLLLLIGTSVSRQLPTIRSRSQVVRMRPLSQEVVAEALRLPPHELGAEEARVLAKDARGSVARALAMAAGPVGEARRAVVGAVSAGRIEPIRLAKLFDDQSKAQGTEPRLRRRMLRELLGAAVEFFHARLHEAVAQRAPTDALVDALDACVAAEAALGRNANQSALTQSLAERLARLAA